MFRCLPPFFIFLFFCLGVSAQSIDSAREGIDPELLAAGERMILATGLTRPFDLILPEASKALKSDISDNNRGDEYRFDLIFDIVDEEALSLASRRGVLEREALRLVVSFFTTDELDEISRFFLTTTGSRFFEILPYTLSYSLDELSEISDFLSSSSGRKLSRTFPIGFRFTVSEMSDIRSFLLSPVGVKFHETMPMIFGELGNAGRIWGDGVRRDLARNVMLRANQLETSVWPTTEGAGFGEDDDIESTDNSGDESEDNSGDNSGDN